MRALVIGSTGFVGGHLKSHLGEAGDTVLELDPGLDITNTPETAQAVQALGEIDAVYHLAARSHVGQSWEDPIGFYEVNVLGTANVCAALASFRRAPRLLFVSSSEVYGTPSGPSSLPFTEESPLRPVTPYAASKAAAEAIVRQAHYGVGLPVLIARSFNHTGPGQSADFVIPGLACRAAQALSENPAQVARIAVGNLEARRDFTDVRDVVRAYRQMIVQGVPGETYNVCSGYSLAISDVTRILEKISGSPLEFFVSEELVRKVEVPELYGSAAKLENATGWRPEVPLEATVAEILRYWRDRL